MAVLYQTRKIRGNVKNEMIFLTICKKKIINNAFKVGIIYFLLVQSINFFVDIMKYRTAEIIHSS